MKISRTLTKAIKEANKNFRVLLLTGPRQVGKTTLLKEVDKGKRSYVTLDDLNMRAAAIADPAGFIARLKLPVLIDEVQYAPDLFPYIKMVVDQRKERGLFWLTGSQQFDMMKNVTESLAGRVAILKLQGISLAEEEKRKSNKPFLPDLKTLKLRQKQVKTLPLTKIYEKIWRGSFPDIVTNKGKNWEQFYESYVSTYIQRDIREYLKISNPTSFYKFMQIAASRSGQIVNYADMARDLGVSQPTIKIWLNALHASGIIYLLQPYFNNRSKRLIQTPKLYFMDTGLCAFLTGWLNCDVLERGAMSGAILETYAVSEIIKSYINCGRTPHIFFYRDKEKREIDLLIEENNRLYPIEIKKTASIKNLGFIGFNFLENLKVDVGHGAVLCFVSDMLPISKTVDAVPVSWI